VIARFLKGLGIGLAVGLFVWLCVFVAIIAISDIQQHAEEHDVTHWQAFSTRVNDSLNALVPNGVLPVRTATPSASQ
jgi:hypothetical protein